MSRLIEHLIPQMQIHYYDFEAAMRRAQIEFIVTCTYRDNATQAALYAQGRTTGGKIVTRARPGQSAHNFMLNGKPASKAFDIVIIKNGKPDWDVLNPDWYSAGAIGKELGMQWAGDWESFKEFPHFQMKE